MLQEIVETSKLLKFTFYCSYLEEQKPQLFSCQLFRPQ